MFKKVLKFILIVICMLCIYNFSSDNSKESAQKSNMVIIKIASIFEKDLNAEKKQKFINKYSFLVRKAAHFTIYFILGILLISFFKEFSLVNYKSMGLAILIAFLYACSDEFHQVFVNGRSGEFKDIMLDTLGAFCGIILYKFFRKWF